MNDVSAKQTILEKTNINVVPERLQVTQLDDEPSYWFVSLLDESNQHLIGGVAYIVNADGAVYETNGSLPPSVRLAAAKTWFASN